MPKLDNARTWRSTHFIDSGDMEFQARHVKRAQKGGVVFGIRHALQGSKLWAGRYLCRNQIEYSQIQICMHHGGPRIYEKGHWKDSIKDHEDHIAGEGFNSLSHYNLVHKFILLLQAMKNTDANAAVDKEKEKPEKCWHGK